MSGPHLPSAVANELTEVGWPAKATPVHQDSTVLLEPPKFQAERDKREARVKRYRLNRRDRWLAYQRNYNATVRPNKRTEVAA